MTPENWRDLLGTWSRVILGIREYRREFPPEVVKSGWLGFPGAMEDEIAAAEARLGITLPPSYRTFLAVTNGWPTTKTFIDHIRPVSAIAWYRDAYPELLAAWRDGEMEQLQQYGVTDETEASGYWLAQTLAVSDDHEAALLLLPARIGSDGEWPAWFFAAWLPGWHEFPSFWHLMVEEYNSFLRLSSSNNGGPRRVDGRRPPIPPFRP